MKKGRLYDRQEIAAGQSRYQIAEQPIFAKRSPIAELVSVKGLAAAFTKSRSSMRDNKNVFFRVKYPLFFIPLFLFRNFNCFL